MQFKSVSFWSGCLNSPRPVFQGLILLALGVVVASSAEATMTATVTNANGFELQNVVNNVAYYPASTVASPYADDASNPPLFFRDTGDNRVANVVGIDTGVASGSTDRSQLVYFSVVSDKDVTPPDGGFVVLFATAQGTAGGGEKVIPLAFVGDASGNGDFCRTNSGCLMRNTINATDYQFAYNYTPKTTLVVGLYPADICLAYNQIYGGIAYGCGGTGGSSAPVTSVVTNLAAGNAMQIQFYVSTLQTNVDQGGSSALAGLLNNPTPTDQSATTTVVFEQLTSPTLTCVSQSALSFLTDVYRPGDSEIIMDATRFSSGIVSGVAPVSKVIVIGNDGADPVVKAAFEDGSNAIRQRIDPAGGQSVGGFTNTSTGADHSYNIAFLVRDAAGIVVTAQGNCSLDGVQTAQIQGFLNKSSCFIATAAYRSNDAAPVMMLRRFRDQILLKSDAGRAFVKWYYHWSPGAAEWLMRNPAFRYPVLVALVPVEIVAWCLLNPVWAGAGFLLLVLLGMAWMVRRMTLATGVSHET